MNQRNDAKEEDGRDEMMLTRTSLCVGTGTGRASKCVSKDRNSSVSSALLWSTTLETSFCRKLRALIGGTSSHFTKSV